MAVIKEYRSDVVDNWAPSNPNGGLTVLSTTCILRGASLTELFTAVAADTKLMVDGVRPVGDHLEFETKASAAELKQAGYKKLPPKTIAERG